MPNWVYSEGTITGSKEAIQKFIKDGLKAETLPETINEINNLVENANLSLGCWLPRPKIYDDFDTTNYPERFPDAAKEQKELYGYVGWRDWNIANYGCKWDCKFDSFNYTENEENCVILFYFDSPWSPAAEWFGKMQEMYPDLNFVLEYIEPGNCFAGYGQTQREGESVWFEYSDYDNWEESPLYTQYEDEEMVDIETE